jgi:Na+-transporting methylmalonyl-CoA/oxaloacetate decarboxylase gamma subunit
MRADLLLSLEIMWKGMAGTFIVSIVVIIVVKLLARFIRSGSNT